jgi:hypothetical protein
MLSLNHFNAIHHCGPELIEIHFFTDKGIRLFLEVHKGAICPSS